MAKEKTKAGTDEVPEPGEPMHPIRPEIREGWMENSRLILAERDRIEAAKQALPKAPEVTPDENFHQQDSAA